MSFATQFKGRKAPSIGFHKPSTVQPHFKSMCDVNAIVARAMRGDPTALRAGRLAPQDVDITGLPDTLHEALQRSVDARNAYEALSPEIKAKYPTPEAFFAACHDKTQIESLRECGALEPSVAPAGSADPAVPADPATPANNPVTPQGA